MKKKWSILLSMALCFGLLAGCGGETTGEPVQEEQQEQEVEEDERGIAGSHYYDMCYAMMQNGFPQYETSCIDDPMSEENQKINIIPYSHLQDVCTYTYGLSYIDSGELVDGSFSIANTSVLDGESFLKEAKVYLNFCATMPYDTMDAEKLQEWIGENLDTVGNGEEDMEIVVGDVKFMLVGTEVNGIPSARTLYFEKAHE